MILTALSLPQALWSLFFSFLFPLSSLNAIPGWRWVAADPGAAVGTPLILNSFPCISPSIPRFIHRESWSLCEAFWGLSVHGAAGVATTPYMDICVSEYRCWLAVARSVVGKWAELNEKGSLVFVSEHLPSRARVVAPGYPRAQTSETWKTKRLTEDQGGGGMNT